LTTLRSVLALALALAACAAPSTRPLAPIAAAPVDPDPDGDGLVGDADRCPDAPEDCDGVDDGDGCPDPDDDGDGVPDVCDACPGDRGDAPDGCPDRVVVRASDIQIVQHLYFEANRVTIPAAGVALLDAVAAVLREHPEITHVEVGGHASVGERDPARASQARAVVARDWLVAHGVAPERLTLRAYSVDMPIVAAATPAGRARNRRVSFRVVSTTAPEAPRTPPRRVVPDGCPAAPPPPPRGPCAAAR
jgi:outer membrane protein OmpA-like peptidoglycan-associated protein